MASQVYMGLEEAIEMIDNAIALSPEDIAYQNMREHILRAFGLEQDLVYISLKYCNKDQFKVSNN